MQISSKSEFYRLWRAGVLGNRPEVFATVEEAGAHRQRCPSVGFREVGKAGGGAWELVPNLVPNLVAAAYRWQAEGRRYTLDGGAPNGYTALCGEVARTYRGLEGNLAVYPWCSMREAKRDGLFRDFSGSTVLYLLDRFMDPASRDDVDALLDLYPNATVEFSCFTRDVGVIPNRNTIFWETRDY